MVIQLQTSFIPKKTSSALSPSPGIGGRSINVFGILALIVFFITVGLAVFVFFYKSHLITSINEMDAALALAKKSFEPEFIATASRLNSRIEAARELLSRHRSLSPLFTILEKKTLEQVRFQDFHFTAEGGREVAINMRGQAKSFNAVALQSDVFGTEPSFKDPMFSNFSLDERGDVTFDFKTTVDPKLLLYSESLLSGQDSNTKGEASAK